MRESTAKAPRKTDRPPVLVIGAGPAGVVTGYFLKKAGVPYEIIDRAQTVASTWASLYPSLRLNTTRYFSHMPHQKFPLRWGTFPTGRQYHEHVTQFARAHALNIMHGVDVSRVSPTDGGWQVESSRGITQHPVVVLATGRFSNPHTAALHGLERFERQALHATAFRSPSQFANQRVMVIGSGPSAIDIAVAVGQQNAPENPAILSMRTGVVLRRRYPLGLSKHAWVLASRWMPASLRRRLLDYVENMSYRPSALTTIRTPEAGATSGAVAYRGPELIQAVQRGHVVCMPGPVEIGARHVTLADGTEHAVDTLIIATGYRPALGFLDGIALTTDDQGWPYRYNSRPYSIDYAKLSYHGTYAVDDAIDARFQPTLREIDRYAGLFQVGLYYKGHGAMYNFNVEAEIAAAQIAEYLT